jgi:hypothetical protein
MNTVLRTPTVELVKAACEKFDQDYLIVEQALKELFNQYPGNNDLRPCPPEGRGAKLSLLRANLCLLYDNP